MIKDGHQPVQRSFSKRVVASEWEEWRSCPERPTRRKTSLLREWRGLTKCLRLVFRLAHLCPLCSPLEEMPGYTVCNSAAAANIVTRISAD
eukprot:1224154-Amphidinium_carterae.1